MQMNKKKDWKGEITSKLKVTKIKILKYIKMLATE